MEKARKNLIEVNRNNADIIPGTFILRFFNKPFTYFFWFLEFFTNACYFLKIM